MVFFRFSVLGMRFWGLRFRVWLGVQGLGSISGFGVLVFGEMEVAISMASLGLCVASHCVVGRLL